MKAHTLLFLILKRDLLWQTTFNHYLELNVKNYTVN